jgi:hypothetical protein
MRPISPLRIPLLFHDVIGGLACYVVIRRNKVTMEKEGDNTPTSPETEKTRLAVTSPL